MNPSASAENTSTAAAAPAEAWPADRVSLSGGKHLAAGDDKHDDEFRLTISGRTDIKKDPRIEMSAMELRELHDLRRRDREVRNHEQAHLTAAGQYAAGAPSYSFRTGPDGKRYVTGGEVPIDIAKEATPEETLKKMQVVAHAALAPLHPSAADRRIAARAAVLAAQAKNELRAEKTESSQLSVERGSGGEDNDASPAASSVESGKSNSRQLMARAYRSQSL